MTQSEGRLTIGKDIKWKDFSEREIPNLFKVIHFFPWADVQSGKVKAKSRSMPLGAITLDTRFLDKQLYFYLTHRLDFLHLYRAFEWIAANEDDLKNETVRSVAQQYSESPDMRNYDVMVGDFSRERHGFRKFITKSFSSFFPRIFVQVRTTANFDHVAWEVYPKL